MKAVIITALLLYSIAIQAQSIPKGSVWSSSSVYINQRSPDTTAVKMITFFDFNRDEDYQAMVTVRNGYSVSHPDSLRVEYLDIKMNPLPPFVKVIMSYNRKKPVCECELKNKYIKP